MSGPPKIDMKDALRVVRTALAEDLGEAGDVTSSAVVAPDARATGHLIARQAGAVAGLAVAGLVFETVDPAVTFDAVLEDGARAVKDEVIATVDGPARSILAAERSALNILQHLSGVASATAEAVDHAAGTRAKIYDTRKTLPGLRALEKYAVAVGGGVNHRMGLFEGVLLKDNHLKAAGGVGAAVAAARAALGAGVTVEVEAETLEEVREALSAGAEVIMLDNMSLETIRKAVDLVSGRAVLEASGGITPGSVEEIAATGVDRISMGSLTDAARLDISLEIGI